jgi:hypothetical protein
MIHLHLCVYTLIDHVKGRREPKQALQCPLPLIFGQLQQRRRLEHVFLLDPFPDAPFAKLSSQLIFLPKPLFNAPDSIGMNFIQQRVISPNDPVFPDIPEPGEVIVIGICVLSGGQAGSHLERTIPVSV